jgi:ribosomal protein S18 acetylase RimI-like enzyme
VTRVRAARWEEAEAVAALFNAINSLDGPLLVPMTADAVRRDLLGPEPWATLLVAELDREVVGFVTSSPCYDSARAAGGFFLVDLYVRPEARRRGVGRALVAALAAEARRRGAGCLWWGVDEGDEEAMLFYRAIGAEAEGPFTGALLVGRAFDRLADEARA